MPAHGQGFPHGAFPGVYLDRARARLLTVLALAMCERIDECKSWADMAMALKSYAKQMNETSLEDLAQRIRDRAVRRAGELLLQIKAQKGKRTDKEPRTGTEVDKD